MRDVMADSISNLGKKLLKSTPISAAKQTREEFWALKDISFDIHQGEKVGIIGRNGAGKSTLLKILSRIVEPTTGRIGIKGRVASLLEVGTGFHPELTGRENIYLNGAILGMTRAEIARKFDEIVDFAEVERFLDTPVKRFSSGMYVRLAFAVAAHLEPEILLIDEVLAVGDALFQKKCLGKMEDVSKREGKTIFFVSHNMQAIRQFCSRAIVLHSGEITIDTDISTAIDYYLENNNLNQNTCYDLEQVINRLPFDYNFKLNNIVISQNGKAVNEFVENGMPLDIIISYDVNEKISGLRVFVELYDCQENLLFRSYHDEDYDAIPTMDAGSYISSVAIPRDWLAPSSYVIRVQSGIFNERRCLPSSAINIPIIVAHTGRYNRAYLGDTIVGKFAFSLKWSTHKMHE